MQSHFTAINKSNYHLHGNLTKHEPAHSYRSPGFLVIPPVTSLNFGTYLIHVKDVWRRPHSCFIAVCGMQEEIVPDLRATASYAEVNYLWRNDVTTVGGALRVFLENSQATSSSVFLNLFLQREILKIFYGHLIDLRSGFWDSVGIGIIFVVHLPLIDLCFFLPLRTRTVELGIFAAIWHAPVDPFDFQMMNYRSLNWSEPRTSGLDGIIAPFSIYLGILSSENGDEIPVWRARRLLRLFCPGLSRARLVSIVLFFLATRGSRR